MKYITALLLALQLGLLAAWAQPRPRPTLVYQATLSSNGVPVNVPHDFVLSLHDSATGVIQLGPSQTNLAVDVSNGQCRIAIYWEIPEFSGTNLHLEVSLRRSGSGAPFVTLSPRQRMTHLPLAAVAEKAMTISLDALAPANLSTNGVDGVIIKDGSVTGDKIAAGQVQKTLNGLTDNVTLQATDGVELSTVGNTITMKASPPNCLTYSNCYWNLLGNGNVVQGVNFLGTLNAVPLEFRVKNLHAERFEYSGLGTAPNVLNRIAGDSANSINPGDGGSTIGGGGRFDLPNVISHGGWSVIGGGAENSTSNHWATIAGGRGNRIHGITQTLQGQFGFIGGGLRNDVRTFVGTIAGGQNNVLDTHGTNGAIVAGLTNYADGPYSFIGGGVSNVIVSTASYAGIPSGLAGRADSYGQVVHANGQFGRAGDAQCSEYVLRRTVNATNCVNPGELFLDGDPGASERMRMPINSTWTFEIMISARSTTAALSAGSKICGLAQCNSAGVASLAGAPTITQVPGTATLNPIVDVIGNNLILKICNDTTNAFRVVACVHTSQVQNP